ncbi:MAG: sialidase family protein [Bacteroidota bacterium]
MNKNNLVLIACLSLSFLSEIRAQWTELPAPDTFMWQLSLPAKDSAYVISIGAVYKLHRSFDGGNTWNTVPLPDALFDTTEYRNLSGMAFADGKTGILFGSRQVNGGVYGGGAEGTWMARTTDGGESWMTYLPALPDSGLATPDNMRFFDTKHGVLFMTSGYGFSWIKTTQDAGLTWQDQQPEPLLALNVHTKPDGSGALHTYDFGDFFGPKLLYTTSDFGAHWSYDAAVSNSAPFPESQQGLGCNNIYMINANEGFQFSSTEQGTNNRAWHVARTQDGGFTWSTPELIWQDYGFSAFEIKESVAWVLGQRHLYKRTALSAENTPEKEPMQMTVSPNPIGVEDEISIHIPREISGKMTLQVLNSDGRLELRREIYVEAGKADIRLEHLCKGFFVVKLINDREVLGIAKIVIP